MSNQLSVKSFAAVLIRFSHGRHALKILYLVEGILFIVVCSGFLDCNVNHKTPSGIENLSYATQPRLKGWDDERLVRKIGETDMEYATRMNKVVGSSFYHCLYSRKENIFEMVAALFSKSANVYGFLQPWRSCGFCHQAAYILSKVLTAQGIEAFPLGMIGHVCVLMKDGSGEYIFDPDYAVGPMLYLDDMTPYIPKLYGTGKSYKALYDPFATNKDDRPYSTMQNLMKLEAEQNRILGIVKGVYFFCVCGFILNTLLIIIKLRSSKH